jgi:hypothetical protein
LKALQYILQEMIASQLEYFNFNINHIIFNLREVEVFYVALQSHYAIVSANGRCLVE